MSIDALETARLALRKPIPSDAPQLFKIYGDPATNLYNPHGPFPDLTAAETVLEQWLTHWHEHGFGPWAIASLSAPDAILGFGGLSCRAYGEVQRLNLGYRFAQVAWGKGYATEFSRAALQVAFAELKKPEVFAIVRPTNVASRRVLEKVGMVNVGTLDDVPGQEPSLVYRHARDQVSSV
jgi:[ribosomal protein S5]-alanine N-acetyltransferase